MMVYWFTTKKNGKLYIWVVTIWWYAAAFAKLTVASNSHNRRRWHGCQSYLQNIYSDDSDDCWTHRVPSRPYSGIFLFPSSAERYQRTGFWSKEIGFQSQKKVQNSPGPSLGPTCQVDDGMVHFWDRYYIRRYQNIHTLFCPITSLSPEKVQITTPKTKLIVFDVVAMDKLLKIICKGKRRSKMLGFVPPLVGRRTMGDICINSPDMTTAPIVPLPTIYRLLLRCLVTHNKSTVYNHYM